LAALGIRKGATPALHSQVGRLTALLASIEMARDELRQPGPTLDEKTVHRMARQLGAEVLATRTRDLQRFRDGLLLTGQEMVGHHVVAQVDGGRIRIRTQVETIKRKGVKHRRKGLRRNNLYKFAKINVTLAGDRHILIGLIALRKL